MFVFFMRVVVAERMEFAVIFEVDGFGIYRFHYMLVS